MAERFQAVAEEQGDNGAALGRGSIEIELSFDSGHGAILTGRRE